MVQETNNSFGTDSSISEQSSLCLLSPGSDIIVKEEAKEWKECHSSKILSPKVAKVIPVTIPQPVSSTPEKEQGFSHFRITDSGLLPVGGVTPLRSSQEQGLKCQGCYKTFSTHHGYTHHDCYRFKCAECGFRCTTEQNIKSHVKLTHKEQLYKCGICEKGFDRAKVLEEHMTTAHDSPYSCPTCGLVFVRFEVFKAHSGSHCAPRDQCGDCGAVFENKTELSDHIMTKHLATSPLQLLPSPESKLGDSLTTQALFLKQTFLQKLIDLQNGLRENAKPIAKPAALFPPAAKVNLLSGGAPLFHPTALKPAPPVLPSLFERGLQCTQCSATFESFAELHSHLLLHTLTGVLGTQSSGGGQSAGVVATCGECETGFSDKSLLEEHIRTVHDAERPYKCDHCDKTFTRSNNLQEHLRTHTGSRPYVCNYCDKSFARSSILHIHMRTHTKIKPFQCSVCPAAFSHSNSLQAHLRRHTGAKPYICPVCSKAFRQSGTLHRHIRTHNKTKRVDQLPPPKITSEQVTYPSMAVSGPGYSNPLTLKLLADHLSPIASLPKDLPIAGLSQDASPLGKENKSPGGLLHQFPQLPQ